MLDRLTATARSLLILLALLVAVLVGVAAAGDGGAPGQAHVARDLPVGVAGKKPDLESPGLGTRCDPGEISCEKLKKKGSHTPTTSESAGLRRAAVDPPAWIQSAGWLGAPMIGVWADDWSAPDDIVQRHLYRTFDGRAPPAA
ncbi:MAG: hypothetical protein GEU93_22040 [Propionibacteriales bacterium]|nr:hypothetical protein [Propionibacteriales bacterium]